MTNAKRIILPYNPILKERARMRRQQMTLSETLLWNELKQRKMPGMDFDRQRPILHYIVDFYCKDLLLAIEIDGSSHEFKVEEDALRQKEIESLGVRFLRSSDLEVKIDMRNVLWRIENWVVAETETHGFRGRRLKA